MNLDLACGRRCATGYTGVDISADTHATLICDLRKTPWEYREFARDERMTAIWSQPKKFDNGSIRRVRCQHFLEHLTGPERIAFMDELWRILVPGGQATIITPYWSSWRAVADPTHVFPPICPESYCYFSREWRELNLLTHYPIRCNFSFIYTPIMNPEVDFANEEHRAAGMKHYHNVIDDLEVELTKEA